jgi:hypothetical protein
MEFRPMLPAPQHPLWLTEQANPVRDRDWAAAEPPIFLMEGYNRLPSRRPARKNRCGSTASPSIRVS